MDPELEELLGKGVATPEAVATPTVAVQLTLTSSEVRAIVDGARLLEVRASRLVSWAGSVNAEDHVLPRWKRPFVAADELARLCLLLDPGQHAVATGLAARFGVDTETFLTARTFCCLRRIRAHRRSDPRWQQLEVPAARTPWKPDEPGQQGPHLG